MTSEVIVDLYRILEIQEDASQDEIKRAYHRALLRHHPDKKRTDDSVLSPVPTVDALREAFRILSNPSSRQSYDQRPKSTTHSVNQMPVMGSRPANVVSLDDCQEVVQGASLTWTYSCRCGGLFAISEQLLEEDVHLVGCDSCSEALWIGYEIQDA